MNRNIYSLVSMVNQSPHSVFLVWENLKSHRMNDLTDKFIGNLCFSIIKFSWSYKLLFNRSYYFY